MNVYNMYNYLTIWWGVEKLGIPVGWYANAMQIAFIEPIITTYSGGLVFLA